MAGEGRRKRLHVVLSLEGAAELLSEMARTPMGFRVTSLRDSFERDAEGEPTYCILVTNDDLNIDRIITEYVPWVTLVREWTQEVAERSGGDGG